MYSKAYCVMNNEDILAFQNTEKKMDWYGLEMAWNELWQRKTVEGSTELKPEIPSLERASNGLKFVWNAHCGNCQAGGAFSKFLGGYGLDLILLKDAF